MKIILGQVKPKSVAKLLSTAIQLLKTKGWIQGSYESPKGFCLVGVIEAAQTQGGHSLMVADAAENYVALQIGSYGIPRWNDRPNRTKDEVLKALKDARAAALKEA